MKKLSLLLGGLAIGSIHVTGQTLSDYQTTISNQSPIAYFKLDNTLASSVDPDVTLDFFGAGGFGF